jgi:DNA-binding beta-propeller fold protein YncE
MKFAKQVLIPFSLACLFGTGFSASQKTLAELYKTGKVKFVQELMLDEKTMPKDVLFAGPGALDCDASGNVYVMDFSDNNIKQFDAAGKFLKLIGRKGQGPGEFNMPIDVVFAKDRLVVWDMGNDRLCALTISGGLIKAENASAFSGRPVKVGALPTGEIVLDTEKTYFNEPDRPQDRFLEILTPDLQTRNKIYSKAVLRNKYMRIGGQLFNIPQPFGPDIYWGVSPSGSIDPPPLKIPPLK